MIDTSCTATIIRSRGPQACGLSAVYIATDPKDGERYFRCEKHAQEGVKRFGFTLERFQIVTTPATPDLNKGVE